MRTAIPACRFGLKCFETPVDAGVCALLFNHCRANELLQFLISGLALMDHGVASVFTISDISRLLALMSLLVYPEFDHDLRLTRDRLR